MFGTPESAVALAATIQQATARRSPVSPDAQAADKMRAMTAGPRLRNALANLLAVVRAMDCELDGPHPTEEEYEAALAEADAALAEAGVAP
jgi:hypothetical protein